MVAPSTGPESSGHLSLPDWPRALGETPCQAMIRSTAEDFQVDEVLGFEPDGDGEHLLIQIRKRNLNTDQVARQLAQQAGIRQRDVSYCGLKDRRAVTSQWFSLHLPGKSDPDFSGLENDDLQILARQRHRRKLPRGALQANCFVIVLRNVHGDRDAIEQRLRDVQSQGVPNYFGEQRFGRQGDNLQMALAMFNGRRVKDRHRRGLYISAARSYLFNRLLSTRVQESNWNKILPGEACILAGSRSFFVIDNVAAETEARLASGDISPSGPLWGKGEPPCRNEARELESRALLDTDEIRHGLESQGLKQERRALVLHAQDMKWSWGSAGDDLEIRFCLPAGAYATTVLREICAC